MNNNTETAGFTARALATIERVGNKLPDPAVLFIALLFIVWVLSWFFSLFEFGVLDPRTGAPLQVVNQLSGSSMPADCSLERISKPPYADLERISSARSARGQRTCSAYSSPVERAERTTRRRERVRGS